MAEKEVTKEELNLQSPLNENSADDKKDEGITENADLDKPVGVDNEMTQDPLSTDSGIASSEESSTENGETHHTISLDRAEEQETQDDKAIKDDDGEVDLGDLTHLDSKSRNALFEKGLNYDKDGKRNCALKCYMACLKNLQSDSHFPLLPQCLRNIADIFYQKDELDKAVHFIQAEKVYYETALIDTTEIQARLDEAEKTSGNGDQMEQTMDTVRAEEYEHLAKLCLDKDQPQLALEYAGKATKMRQQLLGDSHPVTVQSLDFFASVYAKVGQEQYQGDKEEKKVRFDESQIQNHEQDEMSDETLAKNVLWALLLICCVLLLVLASYLYCKLQPESVTCGNIRSNIYYTYMRAKYIYYHYFSSTEGAQYT
ncbi:uncharacterized protein LOC132555130 isoform X2 [Ylistrum balloti]|uniref:uncharacterized protein LOC132555130 isoform X2 n=1 Tax=Ylistrum balloti TaxID=509963 RepID=UPI0029059E0B|nr:uncharacterized protein LOC132555130 isoform X2 [Ylistrum balloti]